MYYLEEIPFGSAYLVPDLTPLAAHHTLLFFDLAGAGYSTVVKDTARYNMRRVVDDIESIRKHFNLLATKVFMPVRGDMLV